MRRVYPRTYGETTCRKSMGNLCGKGLSPHIRGNLPQVFTSHETYRGVYPRTYGETPDRCGINGVYPRSCRWVYPRTYGETSTVRCGLSPHILPPVIRSIPAHTGKPESVSLSVPEGSIPAHTGKPVLAGGQQGLSPHIRGNLMWRVYPRTYGETHVAHTGKRDHSGSIPAHTGKPGRDLTVWARAHTGLSPHIRGNPEVFPAHGETGVYPRTYGETLPHRYWVYPRTYGEPPTGHAQVGSIPAHTGKPVQTYTSYPV